MKSNADGLTHWAQVLSHINEQDDNLDLEITNRLIIYFIMQLLDLSGRESYQEAKDRDDKVFVVNDIVGHVKVGTKWRFMYFGGMGKILGTCQHDTPG